MLVTLAEAVMRDTDVWTIVGLEATGAEVDCASPKQLTKRYTSLTAAVILRRFAIPIKAETCMRQRTVSVRVQYAAGRVPPLQAPQKSVVTRQS